MIIDLRAAVGDRLYRQRKIRRYWTGVLIDHFSLGDLGNKIKVFDLP